MHLEGLAGEGPSGRVDIWVPGERSSPPVVTGANVDDVRVRRVDGGFRVTAEATGSYRLDIG